MHLYLYMLRPSRENLNKYQSSRDSLTHWALDEALIGRMVEREEGIVAKDGS